MTLLWYRLRPVPWPVVLVISTAWLVATDHFGPRLGPGSAGTLLNVAAGVLGVQAAWFVSEDVDPPARLLVTTPLGYWRLPALRLALWSAVGVAGMWAAIGNWPDPLPRGTGVGAAAAFVLASGAALLLASLLGSHLGGGLAIVGLSAAAVIVARAHESATAARGAPAGVADGAWLEAVIGMALILLALVRVGTASRRLSRPARRPGRRRAQ
jgi:hypothetical protein